MSNRFLRPVVALLAMAMVAGCGSSTAKGTGLQLDAKGVTTKGISAERCKANQAAGKLTFLTGYNYAASASIIDVVTADQLGYFKKMCLNVQLQAGFSTDNIPAVSSAKAAFTDLGSASEVAVAVSKGAQIKAIALEGHVPIEELVAAANSNIHTLADLRGTTMGVLGDIPYAVQVMMAQAGVQPSSVKQVQAPYDPTMLARGPFQSRPVYKSAEPKQLDDAGVKYRVFDPTASNVPGSFAALVVNNGVAASHPTAVQDFVRAVMEGLHYDIDHPAEAVSFTQQRASAKDGFTRPGEDFRWSVESKLVQQSTPKGKPLGYLDRGEWDTQMKALVDLKLLPASAADTGKLYDDRFINGIYNGTGVIWPTSSS